MAVKQLFGTWKRLFPCLSTTLHTKCETTLTIIVATAILYNFIRSRHDLIDEPRLDNAVRKALIIEHFA